MPIHITKCESSGIGTSSGSGIRGLNLNYVVTMEDCVADLYIDRGKNSEMENKSVFDQLASGTKLKSRDCFRRPAELGTTRW